ncbi:MAG: YceI family protein [Ignavibacterium sp.]
MRYSRNYFFFALIFILFFSSEENYSAIKVKAKKDESFIQYTLIHPLHTIVGKCKDMDCEINYDAVLKKITDVNVIADVLCFESGNSNRDSHMGEAIDAIDYPEVNFKSSSVDFIRNDSLFVKGDLTFHGVTKNIGFWVVQSFQNGKSIYSGDFNISLTEFNIERPALLTVKTEDKLSMLFKIVIPKDLK